ncbi:hypothetical protein MY5147_008255 [Beauveria neobassiana]
MPGVVRRLFCLAARRASHLRRTRPAWSEPESLVIGSASRVAFHPFHNLAALSAEPRYQWIDGAEHLPNYSPGGYHPVEIGSVLHDRYHVIDKLGYGGWSTVWLVHDAQQTRYLALKVGIAESLPREMPILRALGASGDAPGSDAVPHLVDEFTVEGPHGTHPCYATVPALANLRDVSFSRLFRIDVARALCYQPTLALAFIHSRGFVHGDLHLGNILVRARDSFNDLTVAQFRHKFGEPDVYKVTRTDGEALTPNVPGTAVVALEMGKKAQDFSIHDARLMLSDFGESFHPASEVRLGQDCHIVFDSRPPEAYFEPDAPMSFPSDVWSLAIAIWDIVAMQPLFSSAFYSSDAVRCQIVDQLGPMPVEWFQKWLGRSNFFDERGQPVDGRRPWPGMAQATENCVQSFRRQDGMGVFCDEELAALLDLVKKMLAYRPEQRPTLQQILESEWMCTWARRDYEQSRR